ncbi:uncharacterized protein [Antedon mediterranea]|uniref:uncharacterized protein n=1 Tax=Antedon mediterranea TaxID=105859 RepID=UPI003AF875B1
MDYLDPRQERKLSKKKLEAKQLSLQGTTNYGMTLDEIEMNYMVPQEMPELPPAPSTKPRPNFHRYVKTPLPTYLPPPIYGNKPHDNKLHDPNHHYEELPSPAMVETMIASNNGPVRPPSSAPTETYDDARDSGCSQFSQPEADQQMMQLDRLDSGFSSFTGTRLPLTQQQLKPSVKQMNPRKKQNPLYEDFNGQPPEKKVFVIDDDLKKPTSSSCCGKLKCFRNNCIIPVVIVLALAAIVLVLLMVFGVVEQKESGAISDEVIQPASTLSPSAWPTMDPSMSPEYLLEKLLLQQDQILELTQKIEDLEKTLSGEGDQELNTSDSTRITVNSNKIKELEQSLEDHKTNSDSRLSAEESSSQAALLSIAQLQVQQMEDDDAINDRVDDIETLLSGKVTTLETNQMSLTSRVNLLETSDMKFDVKLTTVNHTLTEEVDSVSKMMGPRGYNGSQGQTGPSGAGNLSLCEYSIAQHGSSISNTITEVSMTPTADDVVFGVTCSTRGGSNYILKVVTSNIPATLGQKEYTCQCAGTDTLFENAPNARYCYLHYWKCPKMS